MIADFKSTIYLHITTIVVIFFKRYISNFADYFCDSRKHTRSLFYKKRSKNVYSRDFAFLYSQFLIFNDAFWLVVSQDFKFLFFLASRFLAKTKQILSAKDYKISTNKNIIHCRIQGVFWLVSFLRFLRCVSQVL